MGSYTGGSGGGIAVWCLPNKIEKMKRKKRREVDGGAGQCGYGVGNENTHGEKMLKSSAGIIVPS